MRMHRAGVLAGGLAALLLPTAAWAGLGLRSKFAEVTVENVKIGQTYSMADLVNFPLRVMNTGSEAVDLRVDVVPPSDEGDAKPGYEPIPDVNWVKLQRTTFTVAPGMEAVTDVVISIPDDPALLGRRFVVYLWSQTQNLGTTGLGLKGRLLLSISSQRPSDEELKQKFVQKRLANLNFSLSPMEASLSGVPLGKRIDLKDFKAEIRLLNPNPERYTYRLLSVPLWETNIGLPPGFMAAPDSKWLEVDNPLLKAKPDSITPLKLRIKIPDDKAHRGRKYQFILRAEILEQDIPAYAYVRIYVETEK